MSEIVYAVPKSEHHPDVVTRQTEYGTTRTWSHGKSLLLNLTSWIHL